MCYRSKSSSRSSPGRGPHWKWARSFRDCRFLTIVFLPAMQRWHSLQPPCFHARKSDGQCFSISLLSSFLCQEYIWENTIHLMFSPVRFSGGGLVTCHSMQLNAKQLRTTEPDPAVSRSIQKQPITIVLDNVLD